MSVKSRISSVFSSENDQGISSSRIISFVVLSISVLLVAVPLYWMAVTSLKKSSQVNAFPPHLVPPTPTLEPYLSALQTGPWVQWFANTAFVSIGATIFTLIVTIPAAYVLSRRDFPGAKPLYVMFLGVMMMPAQILLLPLYVIFARIGLVNSRIGLIIAYSILFLGFSMFLLHSFFSNLPANLEDAARISGISEWKLFLRVILPLAKPGIATTAVFLFVFSWNEFLFALTFLQSDSLYTISVGLQQFQGLRGATTYNQMFAMSTLATLPLVIMFAFYSEKFIQGIAGIEM